MEQYCDNFTADEQDSSRGFVRSTNHYRRVYHQQEIWSHNMYYSVQLTLFAIPLWFKQLDSTYTFVSALNTIVSFYNITSPESPASLYGWDYTMNFVWLLKGLLFWHLLPCACFLQHWLLTWDIQLPPWTNFVLSYYGWDYAMNFKWLGWPSISPIGH